eukprot:CAMPEP_0174696688 /NCGR_PEP_ID=MMETSP1094-20130205/2773_1 /TAXON_ID=156173 /ORGANISM="Chrysochromulina brevifilum, Strain UTEX LB 985" /LENGTH=121 /DNA_ID=CAMNT_0015893515 /DNA_START=121 /DNA_END=488 /DNA_ORIENTATION=-
MALWGPPLLQSRVFDFAHIEAAVLQVKVKSEKKKTMSSTSVATALSRPMGTARSASRRAHSPQPTRSAAQAPGPQLHSAALQWGGPKAWCMFHKRQNVDAGEPSKAADSSTRAAGKRKASQ